MRISLFSAHLWGARSRRITWILVNSEILEIGCIVLNWHLLSRPRPDEAMYWKSLLDGGSASSWL